MIRLLVIHVHKADATPEDIEKSNNDMNKVIAYLATEGRLLKVVRTGLGTINVLYETNEKVNVEIENTIGSTKHSYQELTWVQKND